MYYMSVTPRIQIRCTVCLYVRDTEISDQCTVRSISTQIKKIASQALRLHSEDKHVLTSKNDVRKKYRIIFIYFIHLRRMLYANETKGLV